MLPFVMLFFCAGITVPYYLSSHYNLSLFAMVNSTEISGCIIVVLCSITLYYMGYCFSVWHAANPNELQFILAEQQCLIPFLILMTMGICRRRFPKSPVVLARLFWDIHLVAFPAPHSLHYLIENDCSLFSSTYSYCIKVAKSPYSHKIRLSSHH